MVINLLCLQMETNYVTLANGGRMPLLGIGTSHNEGGACAEALVAALSRYGYRLVDTAQRYGSEGMVGDALATISGSDGTSLCREDIFVTTKLWPNYYGFDTALEQVKGA